MISPVVVPVITPVPIAAAAAPEAPRAVPIDTARPCIPGIAINTKGATLCNTDAFFFCTLNISFGCTFSPKTAGSGRMFVPFLAL